MARLKRIKGGFFVTFEGIDGCGKSTQLTLAQDHLAGLGYEVATLREPGSTPTAERIRKLLLDPKARISDVGELLLYEAARAEVTSAEIAPRLKAGLIVLCDRFYDSTTAYQGYGRKLDIKMVKQLHRIAVGSIRPDLTLVVDVDLKTAFSRRGRQLDRLESQSRDFFQRVRRGFLELARQEKTRIKVVDGTPPPTVVFEQVRKHIERKLNRR
ncbi:MAG: dTMP kinase [candidate division Zixibacteria bacterium]|nr:dTMP kinase [candidate division Zixibacteria bacterium]